MSFIIVIIGETKVGKSRLAMSASNCVMIDMTPDSNSKPAAFDAFNDEFEERYFKVDEDCEEVLRIIDKTDAKTVCLDEGKNLRNAFAKPVLEEINEERAAEKPPKKAIKTIFPINKWQDVYVDINDMFNKYDGKKNFVITQGMKEKRVFDKESKQNVLTGTKVTDGLNILPTVADVILHVAINDVKAGSPPKVIRRDRVVTVVVNRFLDKADSDVWVETVKNVPDLIDRICEKSKFKLDMFVL